jgi:putative component of toxin-antitoxin plasmid stabilization module
MSKIYIIVSTATFETDFVKLIPDNKKEDVKRRIKKLSENPYTGKPLGNIFLREMKLDKFRLYYLIYESKIAVLLIGASDKKTQKKTIKRIKLNLEKYSDLIEKNLNKIQHHR